MSNLNKKIEEYLKSLKSIQKISLFLSPVLIAIVVIYMVVQPYYKELIENEQVEQRTFYKRIKRKSSTKLLLELKSKKQEVFSLKEKIEKDRDDLNYLKSKLSNLNISSFDDREWTITLEKILEKSQSLNLEIDYIKNSAIKLDHEIQSNTVKAKKYVQISGNGSYDSILKYIDFIESIGFLIEIKDLQMHKYKNNKDDKVTIAFMVDFMIYGINL